MLATTEHHEPDDACSHRLCKRAENNDQILLLPSLLGHPRRDHRVQTSLGAVIPQTINNWSVVKTTATSHDSRAGPRDGNRTTEPTTTWLRQNSPRKVTKSFACLSSVLNIDQMLHMTGQVQNTQQHPKQGLTTATFDSLRAALWDQDVAASYSVLP